MSKQIKENDNKFELSKESLKILNNLPVPRKVLVTKVLTELQKGELFWQSDWVKSQPHNAISKKKYNGVNEIILTIDQISNKRKDPRYLTFNQAIDQGWKIKKGASGIPIEFFRIIDIETKKEVKYEDYIRIFEGMTADEFMQWKIDHLKTIHRYSNVFSADDVDGIPEYKKPSYDKEKQDYALNKLIDNWCCDVSYGGEEAYYNLIKDEIKLPTRSNFKSVYGYYSVALHEMAHSTGHESRLDRNIKNKFGTVEYAKEELRAEMSSIFMCNSYDLITSEEHIKNHSAYVQNWFNVIRENPKELFLAIKDAMEITTFIDDYAKTLGISINASDYIKPTDTDTYIKPTDTDIEDKKVTKPVQKIHWQKLSMNESEFVKRCNKATLFNMPKGSEYEGFQFYHPNKLVHMKETNSSVKFNLNYTNDYIFNLTKGDEKVELSADKFFSQISKQNLIKKDKELSL